MADTEPNTSTTAHTVTRTLVCPLQTSTRKNDLVRSGIEEFQQMAGYMADILPTYPEHEWTNRNTSMYRRITDEFPKEERDVKATTAREAAGHVAEAFAGWRERGKPGDRPSFGDGSYLVLSHQDATIEENERGFGLRASFVPYQPEWFHVRGGEYQEDSLRRAVNDGDTGSAELHLDEDGNLMLYLTVKWDVEVYESDATDAVAGVDLGENVIYSAAVVDSDGAIQEVEMEPGREFRHHRERLDEKRRRLSEKGDLRGVRETRGDRERYTEQVLDTASRRIVDLVAEHAPAAIALEDLTHYRETADDPIHDWPYASLQEKIAYKATEAGIPVETVDPKNTSITCRKCGQTNPEYRDGDEFHCTRCGYEVHADVNAAINIAERGQS